MITKKNSGIILISMMMLLLIASIAISLYIGKYLHPFADDYAYGYAAYHEWLKSHSLTNCLQAAWNMSAITYNTWQGSYTACFLMSIQPGIFGMYWITPIILIISIVLSTYLLAYILMRKILRTSIENFLFVSTMFVLINIQLIHSPYDAFYWYNGAIYYTLYYSFSLILCSLIITYYQCSKGWIRNMVITATISVCIFIGGGNIISGFVTGLVFFTAIIIFIAKKKSVPVFCVATLTVFGIAFAFNIFAPGNAFRIEEQKITNPEYTPNILKALCTSLLRGGNYFVKTMSSIVPLAFIAISPKLYKIAKESKFKFSHPWICISLSSLIYWLMFFPHNYATDYVGPNRVRNIYSLVLYWIILIDVFYLLGATARQKYKTKLIKILSKTPTKHKTACTRLYYSYIITVLILIVATNKSTTNQALHLLSGTIQKSDKEMKEREQYLKESKCKTIVLKPLRIKLPSDAFSDAKTSPHHWINEAIASYYDKKIVVTKVDAPIK